MYRDLRTPISKSRVVRICRNWLSASPSLVLPLLSITTRVRILYTPVRTHRGFRSIDRSIDPISSWCAELHELGTRQIMGFITAAPVRIDLRHAVSATSLSLGPSLPRCLSRGSCYTTYKQATQRDLYIIHNFYNILDTTRVGLSTAVVTKNAQCFQPRPRMWRNILMIKA